MPQVPENDLRAFGDTIIKLHKENTTQIETLRTILLDNTERLAVAELTAKHADEFRLQLLRSIEKIGEKLDVLRELPLRVTILQDKVEEMSKTVNRHDQTFMKMQGGFLVGRFVWVLIAGIVAFAVSVLTQLYMKG